MVVGFGDGREIARGFGCEPDHIGPDEDGGPPAPDAIASGATDIGAACRRFHFRRIPSGGSTAVPRRATSKSELGLHKTDRRKMETRREGGEKGGAEGRPAAAAPAATAAKGAR